jgi:phenylacetate-CoA ligase
VVRVAGLRTALVTGLVDPIIWRCKRTPIGAHLRNLRKWQWGDPAELRARQAKLLADLLTHAVTRVPFYRERVSGLTADAIAADPFGSLASFPILEREDVKDHPEDLVVDLGRGMVNEHTSGSTYMPLAFVRDNPSIAASSAGTLLALDWAGFRRGDRRVRIWGHQRDIAEKNTPLVRLVNLLHNRTILDSYDIGDAGMRRYVRFLNDRPPVAIEATPWSVFNLAQYAERCKVELPKPRAIIIGGAPVPDEMRETVGRAFACPVFIHYGDRECGLIAAECDRHEGMHVLGDSTMLEILDDDGKPLPDGETGEIIATHFWNHTLPFIRYRTADRGALSTRTCSCGRVYPLLEPVLGRSSQRFVKSDGSLVVPHVFFGALYRRYGTPDVRKWQIVQEAINHVVVRFVPEPGRPGYTAEARMGIAEWIRSYMGPECKVDFTPEDDIEPAPSRKYFYAVSKVHRGPQQ